ncbi:hypothetical protein Tco_1440456, partial [Tanacetum coccineum]
DFTRMMQARLYRKIGSGIVKYDEGFIHTLNTSPPLLPNRLQPLEVPDEPKDNFGSSSSSLSGFDDEVQDVSSDEKNKADEKQSPFRSCRETSLRCITSLTVSSAEYIKIQSMVDVPIHQADHVVQRT